MKRIYAFILSLCVSTIMNAQTGELTNNVIKVNGGLDFVTSKMYLPENYIMGPRLWLIHGSQESVSQQIMGITVYRQACAIIYS